MSKYVNTFYNLLYHHPDPWRNGSASDSRSEGCVFDSRRVQIPDPNPVLFFIYLISFFGLPVCLSYKGPTHSEKVGPWACLDHLKTKTSTLHLSPDPQPRFPSASARARSSRSFQNTPGLEPWRPSCRRSRTR
jgi:hypothetical protein